jgi:GntR family transcriptional regulator/MocR family aminotransferase
MELAITLDANAPLPLHQQLYGELRHAILSGRLRSRQRLPSTRMLAQRLGVSRITVSQSYDRLLSEGYLQTVVGSGTYVCDQLPDDLLQPEAVEPILPQPRSPISLSTYGERVRCTPFTLQAEPQAEISFRYGRPGLDDFPMALWRRLLVRHCQTSDTWLDYATDLQGYRPLREAIAQYLTRARAVICNPDQILLTNGTQQALDLIVRLLIEPGEWMAIENPGYLSARRIFLSHGVQLLPIPVDESGLQVHQLPSTQQHPLRLVYVTPSHQFPTGALLSLPRRLELLAWAQHNEALIIEDDYDSEYRYGSRPMPSLQGLDTSGTVLYLGTFSKVLFPGLRIGYLVLPPALVPIFAQAKWLGDRQLPNLEQRVLADFIHQGHFESHIRKMRTRYDYGRRVLVDALHTQFSDRAEILGETAGIHLMVRFHLPFSDAEIIQRAEQVGVGLISAKPHYLDASGEKSGEESGIRNGEVMWRREFIFGYSELSDTELQEGIRRLAIALLGESSSRFSSLPSQETHSDPESFADCFSPHISQDGDRL